MNDKKKHFIAGLATFLVGLPVYQFAYDAATDTHYIAAAIWATIVSGIMLALCKEWCDYVYTSKWDWRDFLATCIGVVVVAVFILLLHFGKG